MSDDQNTNQADNTSQKTSVEPVAGVEEIMVSADVTPVETPTETEIETLNEQTSDDMAAHQAQEVVDMEEDTNVNPEELASAESPVDEETNPTPDLSTETSNDNPNAKWYIVHTASGHENRVAAALKQRIESEHLEDKILDVLVPTQDKIEIKGGKKVTVKEKIFPGYILVKMVLDDISWLSVRTTPGVTSFVGIGNKPTPIPEHEVRTILKFMTQGAAPTFKDVFMENDTVKIVDGPFTDFIGKVDSVDKEKGKVRILVSIFGRETPVELDFLQVTKL